jgi:hypothetical protein
MTAPHTVTVYNFQLLDEGIEVPHQAKFKATRELIATLHNARILEGTDEQVPVSELDAVGRFRRVATGWGEL